MDKPLDLKNVRIYKREDMAEAIPLIGQDVYMSDHEDFAKYCKCELIGIRYTKNEVEDFFELFPYIGEKENTSCPYKYFILCKDAKFKEEKPKEKKLRPYKDISEFCNETGCEEVGSDIITIRNKSSKQECVLLYVGYSDDAVHLGGYVLTFETLLKHYEYALNSFEWEPFGVEDDE